MTRSAPLGDPESAAHGCSSCVCLLKHEISGGLLKAPLS